MRNKIILIHGKTNTGKTNLALQAPKPMLYFDSEGNSEFEIDRIKDKDKIIKVDLLIKDTKEIWGTFEKYLPRLDHGDLLDMKTLVVDTCSSMTTWLDVCIRGKLKRDAEIWSYINEQIEIFLVAARLIPQTIIFIARQKQSYEGGLATGKYIIDCHKRFPFWADAIIECLGFNQEENKFEYLIEKDKESHLISSKIVNNLRIDSMIDSH